MSLRPGASVTRPVKSPNNHDKYTTWMQNEKNVKQKWAWEGTQEKCFSRIAFFLNLTKVD